MRFDGGRTGRREPSENRLSCYNDVKDYEPVTKKVGTGPWASQAQGLRVSRVSWFGKGNNMGVKKAARKSAEDVRNQGAAAKAARALRAEKTAAYDVKYRADALARREKLAADAAAQPV